MDNKKRTAIQAISALLMNANFKGFFTGNIYKGQTKKVCVPGLNCYSCPGAVGSCPIGSLQNALSAIKFKIPYYVVGLIIFFGAILGRAVCGFLCPFGLLEDLLYKIPFFKKIRDFKGDKLLRYLKYIILLVMVVILPSMVKLTPFFCKYICPSGTISGILLMASNSELFKVVGSIFTWKVIVLSLVVIMSLMIYRPFCKYLCPLGALYGPFNKISLIRLKCDKDKCNNCGACSNVCDMRVNPAVNPDSAECIRCGKCINVCPKNALKY